VAGLFVWGVMEIGKLGGVVVAVHLRMHVWAFVLFGYPSAFEYGRSSNALDWSLDIF